MSKDFLDRVLDKCSRIPSGKVSTYGEIARVLGKPKASRAVGQALKRNPHAPRIPCHRVVRSDGSIGGYGGAGKKGIEKKIRLLRKEGIDIEKGRVKIGKHLHRF